jgi:hypothetical protein
MAVTVTKLEPHSLKSSDIEVHNIVWALGADVTVEVSTGLSEIYAAIPVNLAGASAGHTEEDVAELEIDETNTAGVITVSGGAITVNRIAQSADGTLAAQVSQLILIGAS